MDNKENGFLVNPLSEEKINKDDLPKTIQGQIDLLVELEEKKEKANTDAENAKNMADNMKSYVSKKFLGKEYQSGDTKAIIVDMQKVIQGIANAQETNAKSTALSFKFMKQLSETSEYLFGLGCFNFAATEKMIEELTAYGQNLTGHNGVSDTIKTKMLEVAKRLNMQKDLMLRQNQLDEKIREKGRELRELKDKIAEMEKLQNKLEQDDRNNKGDIHQLKENASKNKTEIKAVLKRHKWIFWTMGVYIIALTTVLLVILI